MSTVDNTTTDVAIVGLFDESLQRNNKSIKAARMSAIGTQAETSYRRLIEDKITEYDNLVFARNEALDLSPDDTTSLKKPENFDANSFALEDSKTSKALHNLSIAIKLDIARYNSLFGSRAKALEFNGLQ